MSAEAKERLARDFDAKTKEFNRDKEDYETDVQQDEGRLADAGDRRTETHAAYAVPARRIGRNSR